MVVGSREREGDSTALLDLFLLRNKLPKSNLSQMVWVLVLVLVLDMTACPEASATKSKIERGLFVRLCFQSVS